MKQKLIRKIKDIILSNTVLAPIAIGIHDLPEELRIYIATTKILKRVKQNSDIKIFYFGAARHTNLGDLAQSVCIRKWLTKHFDEEVVEIETNAIVNTHFSVLGQLKRIITKEDIIVFQSGYTTTDLGGFADEMHRVIMNSFSNNRMLMMPQTIFFVNKENEQRTSLCYNKMKKMLYLARDKVSYQKALEMFPDISIELFPDIVTTLIGKFSFSYERNGIMFCCRDDGEKYYTENEIELLINKLKKDFNVEMTDTTKKQNTRAIIQNSEKYIMEEIDKYAHYKLVVTDRFHGTILALAAGTPVVILKTTDHKVVTGADWFTNIYPDYVCVAKDLNDANQKIRCMIDKKRNNLLEPYFEMKYYDSLPEIFEKMTWK